MNERIFKLALEAMDFHGAVDTDTHLKMNNSDIEKFAELIVGECGQYLNSPEFIGRIDLDWAMVLNEHFGVEE